MMYCPVCFCRVEPVPQPTVHGWIHCCRHKAHKHLIVFVISERQRDEMVPQFGERVIA